MKISVITPVLNAESFLERCIRSVMEQSYPATEHLIIDGGSTDRSLEIARGFSHLRLISEPDAGIYDAMNKGVEKAHGEWLYFLGADDVFFDKRVLHDISQYLSVTLDVIYGDVISDRFDGVYGGSFDAKKIYQTNICHQSIFFRDAVFNQIGLFNVKYRSQADWDHNMRWLLNHEVRKLHVDRVVAHYADAGFSSQNPDPEFRNDKIFNFLEYGGLREKRFYIAGKLGREFLISIRDLNLPRCVRCVRWLFRVLFK